MRPGRKQKNKAETLNFIDIQRKTIKPIENNGNALENNEKHRELRNDSDTTSNA